jgi:hypothetical protein
MPHLQRLLGGNRLVAEALLPVGSRTERRSPDKGNGGCPIGNLPVLETPRATLLALDPCMGVGGLPQSATGQAALLTGRKVPSLLGYHQGPQPDRTVMTYLQNETILSRLQQRQRRVDFLNAFPPQYFTAVTAGRRRAGAIAQAFVRAGIRLKSDADLAAAAALSADFTNHGWREHLGFQDLPLIPPPEAGQRLYTLTRESDFALFEYWLSDRVGHRRNMSAACTLLETFDQVLGSLVDCWDDQDGLILITSDHGNLEDLRTRCHTANPVPALVIGAPELRRWFTANLRDLSDVAPAIDRMYATAG